MFLSGAENIVTLSGVTVTKSNGKDFSVFVGSFLHFSAMDFSSDFPSNLTSMISPQTHKCNYFLAKDTLPHHESVPPYRCHQDVAALTGVSPGVNFMEMCLLLNYERTRKPKKKTPFHSFKTPNSPIFQTANSLQRVCIFFLLDLIMTELSLQ